MTEEFREHYDRLIVGYGGLPDFSEKVWAKTESSQPNEIALKRIEKIQFLMGRGVFMYGPAGTGKTHLLKCLFNQLVCWKVDQSIAGSMAGGGPFWMKLSTYLEDLRGEAKMKRKALDARWLFVDDMGTSTTTDWAVDQVFQLLDYRVEKSLQTFMTSNFNLEEVAKMYHPRVASRIAELMFPVCIGGPDRRIKMLNEDSKK